MTDDLKSESPVGGGVPPAPQEPCSCGAIDPQSARFGLSHLDWCARSDRLRRQAEDADAAEIAAYGFTKVPSRTALVHRLEAAEAQIRTLQEALTTLRRQTQARVDRQ